MVMVKTAKKISGDTAWLEKPGKYHAVVTVVNEQPIGKNGTLQDGWKITMAVAEGTEAKKQFDLMLFNPNQTQSEKSQDWAMRKQTAFLIAAGLMTEAQLGTDVSVDLQQAVNRHIVIELEHDSRESNGDGKKFLQLAWANIYHIDDPRTKDVPKNAEALKYVPAEHRRKPESFDLDKITGKSSGNDDSKSKVDFSDI